MVIIIAIKIMAGKMVMAGDDDKENFDDKTLKAMP